MKKRLLLALLALALTAMLHAEERMRAGLWEVTTTVDGQPSGTNRSTCYTPAMVQTANSPSASLKAATEKSMAARHCILSEFKMQENQISIKSVCGVRSSATSSTYGVDTFETNSSSTTAGVTVVTQMKGRRVGDCK